MKIAKGIAANDQELLDEFADAFEESEQQIRQFRFCRHEDISEKLGSAWPDVHWRPDGR